MFYFCKYLRFRCSLRIQQCTKNVQNIATTSTSLSLVNFNDHSLSQLSKYKLYMKFQMHSSYYLVRFTEISYNSCINVRKAFVGQENVILITTRYRYNFKLVCYRSLLETICSNNKILSKFKLYSKSYEPVNFKYKTLSSKLYCLKLVIHKAEMDVKSISIIL